MRFDASDLEFLRPLVLEAVQKLAHEIGAFDTLIAQDRIGLTQVEAAQMLGVQPYVLGKCRRRGEIYARKVGKQYVFGRDELFNYLKRPER